MPHLRQMRNRSQSSGGRSGIEAVRDKRYPPIKIAVMGCTVNGPGEARDADAGIAGGQDCAVVFAADMR